MRTVLVFLASFFVACSLLKPKPEAVRQGDTVASVGDWEAALKQYRAAARENPNDPSLRKKIAEAEEKCAELWTRRAEEANREGRVSDAAGLWFRALEVTPEESRKSTPAWRAATENLSALEYAAESASAEARHEDALATFSLLAMVQPDRAGIGDKVLDAKRRVALEYVQESDVHWRKELPGASLVANLRALQYDPMQEKAFANANELRRVLRKRSRVGIEAVVEPGQHKGIAGTIQGKVAAKLGDYPPYGRWKEAPTKATLKAVVEAFEKNEMVEEGVDEMPNTAAPPTDPIPNPAVKEQEAKIDRLEKKLADLQAKMKAELEKKKKRGAPAKKKSGAAAPDPGLELARDLDKTRMDVASAKARLEQLPATIIPPPPDPTWKLPWTKTIRWTEARVRFELREPGFAEPIIVLSEHKVEKSDKTHKGNEKQSVEPDPLQVPSYEDLLSELGEMLAADAASALEKARARRIGGLLEDGRRFEKGGSEPEALDAYVQLLFLVGIKDLPPDASSYLARTVENEKLDAILGKKDD